VPVQLWTTNDASRAIAALGGHDLDRLREAAARPGFRAVPLGVSLSVALRAEITRTESANVIARLPGSDRAGAREAVLFTAHHDHLGVKPGAAPGDDAIYNGAVDNATGVGALLALARAATALPRPPARSLLFAALAAEEQGTLGSQWLARHPPVPAGRLAAAFNMDAMNVLGRTRDVTVVGLGKSSLDDVLRPIAGWQGRTLKGDPAPELGRYYRSDHFPLAKAGVPAAYVRGGVDFVGRPAGWGAEAQAAFYRERYHQPSDEWREEYDLSGLVEDARLVLLAGLAVADARLLPRWRPGEEFEAVRARALDAAAGAP
jgi:Zn-dependent M28 family amino/carboxypeptidase